MNTLVLYIHAQCLSCLLLKQRHLKIKEALYQGDKKAPTGAAPLVSTIRAYLPLGAEIPSYNSE